MRSIPCKAVLAASLLAVPLESASASKLADGDVRRAVERHLIADRLVPFDTMDVTVTDGIATLGGTVDTVAARRRAVRIARSLKGVRSVVDRIEVTPVARSDSRIEEDVKRALLTDPAADSYELKVAVVDGLVTLDGTVDSWAEKQISLSVAEAVPGVKDVKSKMAITPSQQRLDSEIAAEIDKRLAWDVRVGDGLIEVTVDKGRVTLRGTVGSALERAYAAGDAWVAGVTDVDVSGLKVEWWAYDDARRDKLLLTSDDQVERAVKDALLYDPRVHSFDPDVNVQDGVVTLSGRVSDLAAKQAAEADARNTVGVAMVRNHLQVRPVARLADAELEDLVEQALQLSPLVQGHDVDVSVYRGRVHLTGSVPTRFSRLHAETVAARVAGVVDVTNSLLVVRPPLAHTDYQVEREIEEQLFWSPFVDAENSRSPCATEWPR